MASHYTEHEQRLVEHFSNHTFHILMIHRQYCVLTKFFEENPYMLGKASGFFKNMSDSMRLELLLEFAKVTDPAKSLGNDNLSVNHILENIQWPDTVKSKLSDYQQEIQSFRSYIKDARDKILSHIDVQTLLNKTVYAQFPLEEGERFIQNLKAFSTLAYETCFETPWNIILSFPGDVDDFCKILEEAEMFELLKKRDHKMYTELITEYLQSKSNRNM
ncbi:MAG: hypothetical protein GY845_37310 [Planctomycetes bacterium]|nr:hypothetical protein [Planctomycetota bacterium]